MEIGGFRKFPFVELFNGRHIVRRNEYKTPTLLFWQATGRVIFFCGRENLKLMTLIQSA
jgi:hypothetical protein